MTDTVAVKSPGEDSLSQFGFDDPVNITEASGWLKQLGLDYGWGPTAFMEWVLESIHLYTGLPWWASILVLGFGFRTINFKLFMHASDNSAKMQSISHLTKPLQVKMMEASKNGNTQEAARLRAETRSLMKRYDVKQSRIFFPMLVQIPFGFGAFRLLRGMTSLPVPGLENEGVAWMPDLTLSDPYFILPAFTSIMTYFILKVRPHLHCRSYFPISSTPVISAKEYLMS